MPPSGWLKAMRDACRELDILFVADEVITGFGRTGPMFACEHEDVEPDLMTLAKGLTSGYVPMGAVMIVRRVYRAIADGAGGAPHRPRPDLFGASGQRGCRASKCCASIPRGACWRTASAGRAPAAGAAPPLRAITRWSATFAAAACWRRSSWCPTRPPRRPFPPGIGFSDLLTPAGYGAGLIFRAFADGVLGLAPPLMLHGTRHGAAARPPGPALDADADRSGDKEIPRPDPAPTFALSQPEITLFFTARHNKKSAVPRR